jgi:hypothetical protein
MQKSFPWYAVHKITGFVVAGFVEHDDCEKFCGMFSHGLYTARSGVEIS